MNFVRTKSKMTPGMPSKNTIVAVRYPWFSKANARRDEKPEIIMLSEETIVYEVVPVHAMNTVGRFAMNRSST